MMGRSQAQRWAEVFELMGDARVLLILVHMMEEADYVSLKDLSKTAKTSENKTRYYCEKLERENIVDQKDMNDETFYKMINGRQANFVEAILEKLT